MREQLVVVTAVRADRALQRGLRSRGAEQDDCAERALAGSEVVLW
jgi:hypothetical protein